MRGRRLTGHYVPFSLMQQLDWKTDAAHRKRRDEQHLRSAEGCF
jgi:hypothetical protein